MDDLIKKYDCENKILYISNINLDLSQKYEVIKPLEGILDKSSKTKACVGKLAYQSLKHNRYKNLKFGSIINFIMSLGLLFILNIYYRFILSNKVDIPFKEVEHYDYSFGSKIFKVAKPSYDYISKALSGEEISDILKSGDSPFIMKFNNYSYSRFLNISKNSTIKVEKFLNGLDDENKILFIEALRKNESNKNPLLIFMEFGRLKYSQMFNDIENYEEKKKIFLESEQCQNYLKINYQFPEELNENTIDSLIYRIGTVYGANICTQLNSEIIENAMKNGMCELILDNLNIKYEKVI